MKVGTYFNLHEFTRSSYLKEPLKPTEVQIWLIKVLVEKALDIIRDWFMKPVIITSGIRNKEIVEGMRRFGQWSSKRTDHAYLDPEVHQYGVGAADFYIERIDMEKVFNWAIISDKSGIIKTGQIIYYPDRGFCHIANPKDLVFDKNFYQKNFKIPTKYLIYKDGKYHRVK